MKRKAFATSFSFININAFAKLVKFIGGTSFIIAEIMQVNTNAKLFENHDPVHHINGSSIIGWPGSIKTYYVEMMSQVCQIGCYKIELIFFLHFASLVQCGRSYNFFAIYYIRYHHSITN